MTKLSYVNFYFFVLSFYQEGLEKVADQGEKRFAVAFKLDSEFRIVNLVQIVISFGFDLHGFGAAQNNVRQDS